MTAAHFGDPDEDLVTYAYVGGPFDGGTESFPRQREGQEWPAVGADGVTHLYRVEGDELVYVGESVPTDGPGEGQNSE